MSQRSETLDGSRFDSSDHFVRQCQHLISGETGPDSPVTPLGRRVTLLGACNDG